MKNLLTKLLAVSPLKISIFAIVLAAFLFLSNFMLFNFVELKSLDLRFKSRGVRQPGGETLIVAIDEKSLNELGQWPWPRSVIARLIDTLETFGVRAIGLDVVFAEPDETSSVREIAGLERVIEESGISDPKLRRLLDERKKLADNDLILAESLKKAGNVALGYFFHTTAEEVGHLTQEEIARGEGFIARSKYKIVQIKGSTDESRLLIAYAAAPNIDIISEATETSGYFNSFPDEDGTNRWASLVIKFGDNYYPSLPLAVLELYLNRSALAITMAPYGVDNIQIGDITIPTDESGRMLINYLGPEKTFAHYSVSDVINRRVNPEIFRGKIVLVGATSTGIYDLRVTPFSTIYPGLEMHATVIDNILHQNFINRPDWVALIDVMAILVLGLAAGLILSRVRALAGLAVCLGMVAAYIAANRYIFITHNLWLNVVYPVFTILFVYVGITVYKYVTKEREKKKIRGAFQYYLTASVITEILKDPSKLKLGGDKKDLSVLFSDIRGFTTISEKMTPEELVHLLNEYLTAMTDVVFKYDGLLDKYIGDAIMAVFGAPLDQPDHPTRACKTALVMMEELKRLQKKWAAEGKPLLDVGVGINTGDMVVGNMGSQMRFDYTVMGDSVNLASRLEGINKEYGTNIVISEFTRERVKGGFLCRELDSVRVKGKARPVKIYELLGRKGDGDAAYEWVRIFEEGLAHYRSQRWDEAVADFRKVLSLKKEDSPANLYIERCGALKKNPPSAGWDGVYTMTKK